MTRANIPPRLGPDFSVRLRCRACRASHVLSGPIEAGRHAGDVIVNGYRFDVEDIEVIWRRGSRGSSRPAALHWRPLGGQA